MIPFRWKICLLCQRLWVAVDLFISVIEGCGYLQQLGGGGGTQGYPSLADTPQVG